MRGVSCTTEAPSRVVSRLVADFVSRVMQGVTMAFFGDVGSRNFINVFATPLTVAEYVCGLVLSACWLQR